LGLNRFSVGEGLDSREEEGLTVDGMENSLSSESGTKALSYPSGRWIVDDSGVGVVIVLESIGGKELNRDGDGAPRNLDGERGVARRVRLRRAGGGESVLK